MSNITFTNAELDRLADLLADRVAARVLRSRVIRATRPKNETPLEQGGLSSRICNCLRRAGYRTVGEVRAADPADLLAIPNFGKESVREVTEMLNRPDYEP